ncbi:glutamate synthase [NADH] [Onygenales sp. PD_10]|nr:glutamate synthase [NADH] [Onygenales sp. PD_10]
MEYSLTPICHCRTKAVNKQLVISLWLGSPLSPDPFLLSNVWKEGISGFFKVLFTEIQVTGELQASVSRPEEPSHVEGREPAVETQKPEDQTVNLEDQDKAVSREEPDEITIVEEEEGYQTAAEEMEPWHPKRARWLIEQWWAEQQQPNITGDDNLVIPFESIMLRQPGQVMPAPPESDEPAAMAVISPDELAGKVVDWVNRGSADFADDLDSVAEAIQCQLKRRGNRGAEDIPSNQSAEQAQLAYQILMSDHYHMLDPYAVRDGDRISGTVTQVKNYCSKEAKCNHIKLYRAPLVTKPSTSTITLVGVVLSNGYVLAWFKRMLPSLWPRPGGAVDPQNKAEIGQSEDVLGSPESTQSTPALLIAVAEASEPKSDCVVDVIESDQDARGDNRYLVDIQQKFGQIGYEARIDGYFGDI